VGLATSSAEDIDAVFAQVGASGELTLSFSTQGNYAVPNQVGANEDVFTFRPTRLGATTTGTFSPYLPLDGSAHGLANFDLDGFLFGLLPNERLLPS
jgi:hypothetical protein